MKKSQKADAEQIAETVPDVFVPGQKQIETLALRLMPEIKRYFADEQIQREFTEWQEKQKTAE